MMRGTPGSQQLEVGSSLASWLTVGGFAGGRVRDGVFLAHGHIRRVLNIEESAEVGFAVGVRGIGLVCACAPHGTKPWRRAARAEFRSQKSFMAAQNITVSGGLTPCGRVSWLSEFS